MRTDYVDADGNKVLIVHLWDFDLVDCAMCDQPTRDHFAVPWYCGPVAEGASEGGYKATCKSCHDRWAAWNDSIRFTGS